jgi:hypothetical protein
MVSSRGPEELCPGGDRASDLRPDHGALRAGLSGAAGVAESRVSRVL